MAGDGSLPGKGFLKQEEIPLAEFFKTNNGRLYADESHRVKSQERKSTGGRED
jgi:hypothetical protein